jgi:hypothetical protein
VNESDSSNDDDDSSSSSNGMHRISCVMLFSPLRKFACPSYSACLKHLYFKMFLMEMFVIVRAVTTTCDDELRWMLETANMLYFKEDSRFPSRFEPDTSAAVSP